MLSIHYFLIKRKKLYGRPNRWRKTKRVFRPGSARGLIGKAIQLIQASTLDARTGQGAGKSYFSKLLEIPALWCCLHIPSLISSLIYRYSLTKCIVYCFLPIGQSVRIFTYGSIRDIFTCSTHCLELIMNYYTSSYSYEREHEHFLREIIYRRSCKWPQLNRHGALRSIFFHPVQLRALFVHGDVIASSGPRENSNPYFYVPFFFHATT